MNTAEQKLRMMNEEKIPSLLLKMGLPTMIGFLINGLYNVIDAYFVGKLGTSQMGAVAISFPISQMIVGIGLMFGNGAASYISRLLGAGDRDLASRTASTAVFASLASGAALIVISLCFIDRILIFLGATDTILPYARQFATVYLPGAILTIFYVVMNNIATGEGSARMTMTAMVLGAALNCVFAPLFIYGLGMGIRGAAFATVAAQSVTAMLYLWWIAAGKGVVRISIRHASADGRIIAEILRIGIPTFVFQLLTSVAIGLTNTSASHYGDAAVAAMGIVTRVLAIGTFVVFGFIRGFQPVAGFSFGAGNYGRLSEAIRTTLVWTTLFCAASAVIMFFLAAQIVSIFTQGDAEVVKIGALALRASAAVFAGFGFQITYGTLFLSIGRARDGGLLTMSRQGIFFIPAILVLPHFYSLYGVIYSQAVADLLSIALTVYFALGFGRK